MKALSDLSTELQLRRNNKFCFTLCDSATGRCYPMVPVTAPPCGAAPICPGAGADRHSAICRGIAATSVKAVNPHRNDCHRLGKPERKAAVASCLPFQREHICAVSMQRQPGQYKRTANSDKFLAELVATPDWRIVSCMTDQGKALQQTTVCLSVSSASMHQLWAAALGGSLCNC